MKSTEVFEKNYKEYDKWFETNEFVYKSELEALRVFVPQKGKGFEIGVGTGRFAAPLGIKIGVEPAKEMAKIARERGIVVYEASAEDLPFKDNTFDVVLLVVTICFVEDPFQTLKEAKRVLKREGKIIVAFVDKNSFLGKIYEVRKERSKFYRFATFYSTNEILNWLNMLNFKDFKIAQTLFRDLKEINSLEPVKNGYGEGGFVIISAKKTQE